IGIFCTTILSPENKTIILPNGALSTGVITNFNTHGNLRVDLKIGIALDADIDRSREIAIKAMLTHPKVLQSPSPEVRSEERRVGNECRARGSRAQATE